MRAPSGVPIAFFKLVATRKIACGLLTVFNISLRVNESCRYDEKRGRNCVDASMFRIVVSTAPIASGEFVRCISSTFLTRDSTSRDRALISVS